MGKNAETNRTAENETEVIIPENSPDPSVENNPEAEETKNPAIRKYFELYKRGDVQDKISVMEEKLSGETNEKKKAKIEKDLEKAKAEEQKYADIVRRADAGDFRPALEESKKIKKSLQSKIKRIENKNQGKNQDGLRQENEEYNELLTDLDLLSEVFEEITAYSKTEKHKTSTAKESVLEKNIPVSGAETTISSGTKIEKRETSGETETQKEKTVKESSEEKPEEEAPEKKLQSLFEIKKDIEEKISIELDDAKKKNLFEKRKAVIFEILDSSGKISGRDFKREIKMEAEQKFEDVVSQSGKDFERNSRVKYYESEYNAIIDGSTLSKTQKEEFISLKPGEDVLVSSWPKSLYFTKAEAATLIKMGYDLNNIRGKGILPWLSKKFVTRDGKPVADNLEELKMKISESDARKEIDESVQKKVEKRRGEIIENSAEMEEIVNRKLEEILIGLSKQPMRPAREKQVPSAEESVIKVEKKKEKEPKPDEVMMQLNNLRNLWNKAGKINRALIDGKKIKVGPGEIFNPEIESEKNQMERLKGKISNEIIKIASQVSGENILARAKIEKNTRHLSENEYQKYLTELVKKIYKEEAEKLEKKTGKKLVIKRRERKTEDLNDWLNKE